MILSNDEKAKALQYLKISKDVSRTGNRGLLESISSFDKEQAAKIFGKLRNHGILAYLSRSDELILKQIKPFSLDYNWDESVYPNRPDFEESKCLKKCRGCHQFDYCQIRMREWTKQIDNIGSRKRIHPEGHLIAQEALDFMSKSFMGGI